MRGSPVASNERAENSGAVLRRLFGYLRPFRSQLLAALFLVAMSASMQAAGPALIGRAIDVFITNRDVPGLDSTMLLLLGVYVVGLVAQGGQIFLIGTVGQRFLAELRTQIFAKVQSLPLAYFDHTKAGDLMSRLVNDIQVINQVISQGLVQIVGNLFSLVGIVIAMLLLSVPLALASFVIIPIMIWTTIVFARRSRAAFQLTRTTIGEVSSQLQEDITGIRVVQAFDRTRETVRHFAQHNAANRDANVQAVAITAAFTPTIDVLSTLATAIVAGVGGWLAVTGRIPVGTVVTFFIYVQQFFRPIQMISNIYTQMQAAFAGAERIFALVDEPLQQRDAPDAKPLPPIVGRVAFEHVSFGYGAQANGAAPDLVLRDVSLVAEPGQTIALVGPTGAGKSTLVNLILRFYDVTDGRISIDGHDVGDVTLASLRSQMGFVLQENFLFSGSIADNIRYGRLDATDAEVEAAAQAVSAHDFITSLPEGYQTHLGERGGGLSQGQRQLIAFARAVLADPRILILDEATANIDTQTEALIQDALKILLQGRTSFVIAHRLATVRNADQVLVINNHQIIEQGTHSELLAQGGLYADLYRRQFRDEPQAVGSSDTSDE